MQYWQYHAVQRVNKTSSSHLWFVGARQQILGKEMQAKVHHGVVELAQNEKSVLSQFNDVQWHRFFIPV